MRRSRMASAVAVLALAGTVALPLGGASANSKPKPPPDKTIKLKDSFYTPSDLKVKKNTKIIWKWVNANTQSHNVTLEKAPSGVKKSKFRSNTASAHFTFKTKLEKKGNYFFECTIHPTTMQANIKVK